MRRLYSVLLRSAARRWIRLYDEDTQASSVRAVILGDYISGRIILDGVFEGPQLSALARELFPSFSRPATALDIGANIGNHANHFAAYFDRVVAFEPNPQVAAVLRANTVGRPIEVVEMGLSDTPGIRNFEIFPRNLGMSRIIVDCTGVTIQVEKLDALAEPLELDNVRFVKIDVEGHEAQVLAGGARLLSAQHPVIAMEGHYKTDPEKGAQIASVLDSLGYRYFYRLAWRRGSAFDTRHGSLRHLIPRPLRKARLMTLDAINSIAGENHILLIAAAEPLNVGRSKFR